VRVALDARLPADRWGGVQQVIQGIATGMAALGGTDAYLFLSDPDGRDWLDPFLGGNTRMVDLGAARGRSPARRAYDAATGRWPGTMRRLGAVVPRGLAGSAIPRSDGRVEGLGVELIHFLTPQAFLTSIPTIYQPHDLLHVHVPDSFSKLHREYRDRAYTAFSRQARFVVAMTPWGRADLIDHLGLPAERVAVVPWAPVVTSAAPDVAAAADLAEGLPPFVLYPAQSWPHKNHVRLLEALAIVRRRGADVSLVCTGGLTDHAVVVQRAARDLGLQDVVRMLGIVSAAALAGLYQQARALVFPSTFEGWGLPVVEAFASNLPVAAAASAALPDVAGGAALLFDPADPEAIAAAVERICSDEALRDELRVKGRARAAELSWTRSAATFRALYRRSLDADLPASDAELLRPPTLVAAS
jgi:glycosyltransferase involved in cell wall biosynthesis